MNYDPGQILKKTARMKPEAVTFMSRCYRIFDRSLHKFFTIFWNLRYQTSNLRYYLPTLGPSSILGLGSESVRKGQRPFNILPYITR